MIPAEYNELIRLLTQRTSERRLSWETTSDDDKYETTIKGNVVSIQYFSTSYPDDLPMVGMTLSKLFGDKVDFISATADESTHYETLYNLYAAARRNALHIDETISDILSALQ